MAAGTKVKGVSPGERETRLIRNHGLSEPGHLAMGEPSAWVGSLTCGCPGWSGQRHLVALEASPMRVSSLPAAAEAGHPAPGPDTQPVLLPPVATPGGSRAALAPERPLTLLGSASFRPL